MHFFVTLLVNIKKRLFVFHEYKKKTHLTSFGGIYAFMLVTDSTIYESVTTHMLCLFSLTYKRLKHNKFTITIETLLKEFLASQIFQSFHYSHHNYNTNINSNFQLRTKGYWTHILFTPI